MLSVEQQRRVWEGWLSAEIRANYFADLSSGYHRYQRWATWLTLFLSSGAAAAVLYSSNASWLFWVRVVLTLLTTGVSLYSLVAQNQKMAIDSAGIHAGWNKLAREFERLWEDMYAPTALARLNALEDQAAELSQRATAFPYRERLMVRWQDHVVRHHAAHAA